MRKYFLSMLAMAAMLLTVSCSKDAAVDSVANQSAVSFNISTPELTTRAVGDGTTATNLYWAVYGEDGKILPNISNIEVGKGKQFTLKTNVTVSLVRGKKYSFIFWAENENGMCSIDWDAKTMTIEPKLANQEGYDAFWAYYELEQPVNGTINETIELYRPFAQLNIGTSDKAAAANAGMAVKETKISVATFNTLDLVNGTTTGSTICTYDFTDIAEIEGETFPVAGNSYLSMNYLLVSKSANAKDHNENDILSGVKFEYKDEAGKAYSREFYNIPVKRNWKTNIYGTLLTNEANFKVEIKPAFDGENLEKWNGEEMIEPQMVDGVYHVSVAAHLAWILKNCSKDVNMSLDASIDFGGYQIPVNSDNGKFENLTIEGNGNTIYNFVNIHPTMRSSEQGGMVALFPIVYGANVNGLNIKGANVDAGKGESAYAAILFGHTFGTVELNGVNIEDCDVKGTNKVGGLIAMANADGTKTIANNCHVKNTNITTHDVADESGLAGGFFGYINNGTAEIFSSSVEGGKFTVINSRGNKDRANGKFIGGIGSAKVTLDGCSANVTDYNETGAETYDPYHSLVAGNRSAGTLTVDGKTFVYQSPALRDLAAQIATGVITLDGSVDLTAAASHSSNAYFEVHDDLIINGDNNTLTIGHALMILAGTTTINDTDIYSYGAGFTVGYGANLIFNSGNLDINSPSTSGRYLFNVQSEGSSLTINGGNFDFNKTQNQKRAYINAEAGTTVYIKGGNFGKASTRDKYKAGIIGDGTVIITGGSFGFDPSAWVADGYKAAKIDDKWHVVSDDVTIATTTAEVKKVFETGGTIILGDDVSFEKITTIEPGKEVYLNLNGKTITIDENTKSNTLFYVKDGGKLIIDGNGTIDLGAVSTMAIFAPYGELVINNGTFIRDEITTVTNKTTGLFMGAKTTASNVTINGGYFDGGYYNTDAAYIDDILAGTKEFTETADDVAKRGNSKDANKVRIALKDNVSALLNHSGYGSFKVYGGTFVGANPAWGDEGCMLPTTPNYLRPWSYYQGALLDGQTFNENGIVLPEGYTITKGSTENGIPTYTVSYSK